MPLNKKTNQPTKNIARSPDGDADFFVSVAGILQGDSFIPNLFIICRDYILQMSIKLIRENSFILKKTKSRWYPAESMKDAVNADDLVLLENSPAQDKSL